MTRALPLLLVSTLLNGCATSFAGKVEAPRSSLLGQLGGFVPAGGPEVADAEAGLVEGAPTPRAAGPGFGFDRELPADGHGPSDAAVGRLLDWREALRAPARLAVVEARGRRERLRARLWGAPDLEVLDDGPWTVRAADAATVDTVAGALDPAARDGEGPWPAVAPTRAPFTSVQAIPGLFLPPTGDLGKVRYAAARVGADVLLVVARSTRVYAFRNGLANLYPLLIGLLLPAEEEVVVSRVEGAVVDVRTGYVFCVAQGEGRVRERDALLLQTDEEARGRLDAAEGEAMARMTSSLARELAALEAAGRLIVEPGGAQ